MLWKVFLLISESDTKNNIIGTSVSTPITVARTAPDATLKGVSVSMIHAIL